MYDVSCEHMIDRVRSLACLALVSLWQPRVSRPGEAAEEVAARPSLVNSRLRVPVGPRTRFVA